MNAVSQVVLTAALILGGAATIAGQTVVISTPAPAESSPAPKGPRIEFDSVTFNFGKIDTGQVVHHDFIFTNAGSQMLTIRDVLPSCGCTTTGPWDKQIEPGKTGKIPVEFNSTGIGGSISKTIAVSCNDPARTNIFLQLTGTVWRPLDIIPSCAAFSFGPDLPDNDTRVLKIISNLAEAITISDATSSDPVFKTEVNVVREGKEFELRVTVTPPLGPTNLTSTITLRTSSAKVPVITATAFALIPPLVTVTPPRITLPPGPLAFATPFAVMIRNNNTNVLKLSEPALPVQGAKVELEEIQVGRILVLRGSFPAGFTLPSGQLVEIRLKSNYPRIPFVTIQVLQPPATNSTGGNSVRDSARTPAPSSEQTAPAAPQPLPTSQR